MRPPQTNRCIWVPSCRQCSRDDTNTRSFR